MKYIKKYENINKKYKKYLVWKIEPSKHDNNNCYYIFEYKDKISDEIRILPILSYNQEYNFEKKYLNIKSKLRYSHYQANNCIIFQSDNLNECEEYIEIITSQDKFNL